MDVKDLKALRDRLMNLGYEPVRRALAALGLGFFASLYGFVAMMAPPNMLPLVVGLCLVYLVGFFGVAAQWFWGRWYASGLGFWGLMVSAFALVQVGFLPILVVQTVLHGIVVLALLGPKMGALYEQQPGWRERWGLDEPGVEKLGKTVTRTAGSLPALIIMLLAPRDGDEGFALAALALATLGGWQLLRRRAVGALTLAASAGAAALALWTPHRVGSCAAELSPALIPLGSVNDFVATAFLVAAVVPLVRPLARFLRAR